MAKKIYVLGFSTENKIIYLNEEKFKINFAEYKFVTSKNLAKKYSAEEAISAFNFYRKFIPSIEICSYKN